jgi:hypothetical protein
MADFTAEALAAESLPSTARRADRTLERARVRTRAFRMRRRLFCRIRFFADLVLANRSSRPHLAAT